jgi:hypothetical protein
MHESTEAVLINHNKCILFVGLSLFIDKHYFATTVKLYENELSNQISSPL